jgi:predicted CXXCH cytochrome family protein
MKKALVLISCMILACVSTFASDPIRGEYPHSAKFDIGCDSCHWVRNPSLPPDWATFVPQNIDDTLYNDLCWHCHNDFVAPYVKTHSSLTTDGRYGSWSMECRTCHQPHNQAQMDFYGSTSYIYQESISFLSDNSLRGDGGWTDNQFQGFVVNPNITQWPRYSYKVLRNSSDTLYVDGPMDLGKAAAGNTFVVTYGKLVKSSITTPSSGTKTVKFFRETGANSFVDGDSTYDGVCEVCHTLTTHFQNNGSSNNNHNQGIKCTKCHRHKTGFKIGGMGAHSTHDNLITCDSGNMGCHGPNDPPLLADGQNRQNTTVCNNCHNPANVSTAKSYWDNGGTTGSWFSVTGEAGYCGSCHNPTSPGNSRMTGGGTQAPDVMGNNVSYGFNVTGHGKPSGNYAMLSWQATSAIGNPAANRPCGGCHNLASQHFNNPTSRLRSGYENDSANSNCKQCHDPGTAAVTAPQMYSTYAAYQASAHNTLKCTDCHDVHGKAGAYPAMTKGNKQALCYQCHKDPASGGIQNLAISGSVYSNNIQSAFAMSSKHPLGTSFSIGGSTYSLECTSCHNVHMVTGKYWQADQNNSPVTRFSNNLAVWGAKAGEKMNDYAGTGRYQKPYVSVNTFDGTQLPDYVTFCMDCHQYAVNGIVAKNWTTDPHGLKTAGLTGMITGGGVSGSGYAGPKDCPTWEGCGRAIDWGTSDSCEEAAKAAAGVNECWPVRPLGAGTSAWLKGAYDQELRNAGVNYVLSCTDCHEAHGSSNYKLLRYSLSNSLDDYTLNNDVELVNDRRVWGFGSGNTVGVCYACHYPKTREHSYNPGWHNNGVCATGPCHQPDPYDHVSFGAGECYGRCHSSTYVWNTDLMNTPSEWATFHETRQKGTATQVAPAHENGLVLHYPFEGNLRDNNIWNNHGLWVNGAGSYVTGKVGQSIQVNDNPVEVGAESAVWDSANTGITGNTSRLTEMKYNMTLEAWVYPTASDGERKIMAKHTYTSGGYALVLKQFDNTLRVGLLTNMTGGGPTSAWDGSTCNGLRGAYSSVSIPLNQWTHVAATYDSTGPDRNTGNGSVGRIRIYVNGEDVTASYSGVSTCYAQPGAGENAMFPFSDMRFKDPSRCGGNWCASVLSIGGLNWSDTANNFIGRLDEVKVWNVTKNAAYFQAVDAQAAPQIDRVEGVLGSNSLSVTFSEGVYTSMGGVGALQASDFVLTDADNGRTIMGVTHTEGAATATLTLSSSLDNANDIGTDTLGAAANAIYDNYNNPAPTIPVVISWTSLCPTGQVTFNLDEAAGSAYVLDEQQLLYGVVNDPSNTMGGGVYFGDNVNNYISFQNNTSCMKATTALTLEARIKPTSMAGTGNYIARIFAKDTGVNYQMSVWRNNGNTGWSYSAPSGTASIAFWVAVDNTRGGAAWKPVLTDYSLCPVVSDHWYQVKVVWDSAKPGGVPGQKFVPADIYIEDQGTNGSYNDNTWAGSRNCTKADQSYLPTNDNTSFFTEDTIKAADGIFAIGSSASTLGNNKFIGAIDWIKWYGSAGAPSSPQSFEMDQFLMDLYLFLPSP